MVCPLSDHKVVIYRGSGTTFKFADQITRTSLAIVYFTAKLGVHLPLGVVSVIVSVPTGRVTGRFPGNAGPVVGVLPGDAKARDICFGHRRGFRHMTQGVHGHFVQPLGIGRVAGVDVKVCFLRNAVQLCQKSVRKVVVGEALACFFLHVAGKVHRGVVQQLHFEISGIVRDLRVDVVMLRHGVHHEVHDVLFGVRHGRYTAHFLEAGVLTPRHGRLDGVLHFRFGLVGLVVGQLGNFRRYADIHVLFRVYRQGRSVDLYALQYVRLVVLVIGQFAHGRGHVDVHGLARDALRHAVHLNALDHVLLVGGVVFQLVHPSRHQDVDCLVRSDAQRVAVHEDAFNEVCLSAHCFQCPYPLGDFPHLRDKLLAKPLQLAELGQNHFLCH